MRNLVLPYLPFWLIMAVLTLKLERCSAFVPHFYQYEAAAAAAARAAARATTAGLNEKQKGILSSGGPLFVSSSSSSSPSSSTNEPIATTAVATAELAQSSSTNVDLTAHHQQLLQQLQELRLNNNNNNRIPRSTTRRRRRRIDQDNTNDNNNNNYQGLSKYHQSILSRMATSRQRFVSGKYPVICEVEETPTLKWLGRTKSGDTSIATCQLMINGTTVERSLASYDRFQWLDDEERTILHNKFALVSWELLAIININKPGYVRIMPGYGPGSTAASTRFLESTTLTTKRRWEQWKVGGYGTSSNQEVLDELEQRICDRDRLWITGFSLTGRAGLMKSIDTDTGHIESINSRSAKSLSWPNEVSPVPSQFLSPPTSKTATTTTTATSMSDDLKDAVLVSDGFLVPGKDRGGIYVIKQPGNPKTEWTISLTDQQNNDERWFYHRATWVDLTGDGRKSILTARAKSPLGTNRNNDKASKNNNNKKPKSGQLVCLEMPKPFRIDEKTGTPLDRDGTVFDPLSSRHLPWKVHVLDEGPDVMFNVVDMDQSDDTVEVLSAQFFGEKVTLHSIQRGEEPQVTFKRTIDEKCGKAFGCIVADLEESAVAVNNGEVEKPVVIDAGSTVETLNEGDMFSHLLVTSHECSFREVDSNSERASLVGNFFNGKKSAKNHQQHQSMPEASTKPRGKISSSDGGSLFAYRVPVGQGKWKTDEWVRTTVASGFKVQGQLNNMINPGAPGFVYAFHARLQDKYSNNKQRPLIAIAGDCAESAYVFRPSEKNDSSSNRCQDSNARYELMCEIKCGSTVGSIGVGYGDFCQTDDEESDYAKLYIPCYEDDKVLVFGLGSGED